MSAKSFRIFSYALSIVEENTIYGAHIEAANMAKIIEDVVLDCNRVGVFLRNAVQQLLRPEHGTTDRSSKWGKSRQGVANATKV